MAEKILIYAPQSAINPQAALLSIVAKTLNDLGDEVHMLFCDSLFRYCPTMRLFGLSPDCSEEDKRNIARKSFDANSKIVEHYKIDSWSVLSHESESESILECERILDEYASYNESWMNFVYEDFDIGKCAAYDPTLVRKALNLESNPIYKKTFVDSVRDSLLSYLIVKKVAHRFQPTVFIYYENYSILHSAAKAAEKHSGSRSICITHASNRNIDFRKLNIFRNGTRVQVNKLKTLWPKWRDLRLSSEQIREVESDILQRLSGQGSHVFSSGIGGASNLSSDDRPTIVAFTSSTDELCATLSLSNALSHQIPHPTFCFGSNISNTQIEWLRSIASYCLKKNYSLIIRVHPREGNLVGGNESEHLGLLKEKLPQLEGSPKIIWPNDLVSSYDLAELADLTLTSWTSMSFELARLGVPTLSYTNHASLCPEEIFNPIAYNSEQYFEILEKKLSEKTSLAYIKLAFRWWHLYSLGGAVNISDLIFTPGYSGHPEYKLPKEANNIRNTIIKSANCYDINFEKLALSQKKHSEEAEQCALINSLKRIFLFICFGRDTTPLSDNLELKILKKNDLTDFIPHTPYEVAGDGRDIVFLKNNERICKKSTMLNRLMKIIIMTKIGE